VRPPKLERHLAMSALDNSVDRHAPRINNPVPPTDENLIAGLKLYTMNCAQCHGGIDRQPSTLEKSFYPPPPNLILHPPDDEEWHLFYVIRTGHPLHWHARLGKDPLRARHLGSSRPF
jgi:mono/diheme cytochrome c family protein